MDRFHHDDIAIIGIACRFPGDASSPNEFFEMITNGRSAWSEKTPKERYDIDAFYHPSFERQGTIVARGGYFLKEDVGLFDAPFFSMTQVEAAAMDPQQRLLLEVAFESLENAGLPMEKIAGSDAACFVGAFTKDYELLSTRDLNDTLMYSATGNGLGMLANRLSWFYDIRGPSATVDTACSSSLVALHLACQAIRDSGCHSRTAIVGGTGLILSPDTVTSANSLHFFSPDSKCFSFDQRANGYARGEGVSIIVLKHIDAAIRDGDTIRAVIRGSGVNQDGKTPGITLPSPQAQASLIRSTYKSAGLDFLETRYFEAHGTGTAAGDPLEMEAIGSTFGSDNKDPTRPLYVGTVKPNIGHLEGCAGLAGLLKAVMSLESGTIPPNLNFEALNPKIRLDEWNLKIPLEPTPWPQSGLRRASVNSFGYGGTNAHVILDDAFNYLSSRGLKAHTQTLASLASSPSSLNMTDSALGSISPASSVDDLGDTIVKEQAVQQQRLFVFSAPEQSAVQRLAMSYSSFLNEKEDSILDELAHTLGSRRSLFQWRLAVPASSKEELLDQLSVKSLKATRIGNTPKVVWVFTGQGAQWPRMGRELLAFEVFARSVSDADAYLASIGAEWSALTELSISEDVLKINMAMLSQPLCIILQIALINLLHHWGIYPSAVVGHSSGEISAAYASGALSAHDCIKIAFHRGRLSQEIISLAPQTRGSMISVGLSEDMVVPYLNNLSDGSVAVVACVNSPLNVTVSGDSPALEELETILKAEDIFVRKLKVENAYHSPHMKVIADTYLQSIQDITVLESIQDVVMYSSLTGSPISPGELQAKYWVDNMTSPVQFVKAIDNVFPPNLKGQRRRGRKSQAIDTIIEIGPHSALQGPLKQILIKNGKFETSNYYSMLSRGQDAMRTAIEVAGKLWSKGLDINLAHLNSLMSKSDTPKVLVDLPLYPWNHSNRYWHQSSQEKSHLFPRSPRLDLLGAPMEDFNPLEPRWKNSLRVSEQPWLADHKIGNDIILPGAGMICFALEAGRQMVDPSRVIDRFEMRDITIGRALLIPNNDRGVEVFMHLRPRKVGMKSQDAPWFEFTFYALAQDGNHTEHSSGLIKIEYKSENKTEDDFISPPKENSCTQNYEEALQECTETMSSEQLYTTLATAGLHLGPAFQGLTDVQLAPSHSCVTITIPDTKAIMPCNFEYEHLLHPVTLDSCFQSLLPAMQERNDRPHGTAVPTAIDRISISADLPRGAGQKLQGIATASRTGFNEITGSATMSDQSGAKPLISISNLRCTELGEMVGSIDSMEDDIAMRKLCSEIIYREDINLILDEEAQQILRQSLDDPEELDAFAASAQKAALIFIERALSSLTPGIEAALQPHLVKYVKWMREKHELALQGVLSHQHGANQWSITNPQDETLFLSNFKASHDDAKFLSAVGENLPEIMTASVDPLIVMMQDDMLTKTYAEGHGVKTGVHMIRDWFDLKGHKKPNMKILEVGAGTGSITYPIMQVLGGPKGSTPRFGSYVFTDISPGFFENAQELLSDWQGFIEFKKLDIEKDTVEQGFELESFDVIAASNVLHATKRMNVTLENCYRLLKPGGKLILGEITQPSEWLSLIYGTLPGWWLSEDGREGGPCLSQEGWNDELVNAGFTGIDIAVQDTQDLRNHLLSMMVSTKPERQTCAFSKIVVLYSEDSCEDIQALALAISQQLSGLNLELQVEIQSLTTATSLDSESLPLCQGKFVISLLEVKLPLLHDIPAEAFQSVKALVLQSAGLLWVTCGAPGEGSDNPFLRTVSGLFRSLRSEDPRLRLNELHLSRAQDSSLVSLVDTITRAFKAISSENAQDVETEIVEKGGRLQVPRLMLENHKNREMHMAGSVPIPEPQLLIQFNRPLALSIGVPGILESLHFIDDESLSAPLPANEVEIEVIANSLNYKDVMVAMGFVPDLVIGSDAAGVVSRIGTEVKKLSVGDRVALIQVGAMRTNIRIDASLPQKLPDTMSMEHGSTLPTIYVTAYQSLIEIGRLEKEETVLIHSAAGGLGQALIQIAQHIGAEIFVTVGTPEKRELIMKQYGIPSDHIFNSRDLSFAKGVMRMTNGKGVDVVLNSLSGEGLRKTWGCIADFGRFVEVGKRDILANSGLEMAQFTKGVTFASVNIEHMCRTSTKKTATLLRKVFGLVRRGDVKVVAPIKVHDYSDISQVFSTMQQGRHVGKFVFKINPESVVKVIPRNLHPLCLDPEGTYVLVGGLGGLGRGLAVYMADHGAKHIAFISRSGSSKPEAQKTLEELHARKMHAVAYRCDIADSVSLEATLASIKQEMPAIKGLIHAAMVLRDSIFETMDHESWTLPLCPKIQGSWNLHQLMPKELDFFIMLSSATGILGNRGQANYCAGNTFQDALAHYRHGLGLPARSIDLGAIRGLGWVEENKEDSEMIKSMDRILMEQEQFYSVMYSAMTGYSEGNYTLPTQLIIAAGTGAENLAIRKADSAYDLWWLDEVRFAYLREVDLHGSTAKLEDSENDFKSLLLAATTFTEATELIQKALIAKLAKSMMITAEDIDALKPIHNYGVDSLVAIEVRNWIFKELKGTVSVFDILSSVPLTQLAAGIARKSDLVSVECKEDEGK